MYSIVNIQKQYLKKRRINVYTVWICTHYGCVSSMVMYTVWMCMQYGCACSMDILFVAVWLAHFTMIGHQRAYIHCNQIVLNAADSF